MATSGSLLCVGLDPDPETHRDAADAERTCRRLIDECSEYACAFKANIAFFECHGHAGYAALERLRSALPADRLWICDAKRGDIGNTGRAYARAVFDVLGADAVTVNPLMGEDSVRPFLGRPGRGVFILARTSNPGAADILEQRLASGAPLYRHVAKLAHQWDTDGGAHGLVIGATAPDAIRELREEDSTVPFLVPGVGAQGGSLEDAVSAGLDPAGTGVLINVSRAVAQGVDGPAAAAAAFRTRIEAVRASAALTG